MRQANALIKKLSRPYYFETTAAKRWLTSFRNSVFVFLFLVIFQPFGLSSLPEGIVSVSLGYALTTFIVMTLLNTVCLPLFPRYFSEETWNVLREFYWNMIHVLLIGLANALYSAYIGVAPLTPYAILIFELYTITVAVFPIAITVFIKETRLYKQYSKTSAELNTILEDHKRKDVKTEGTEAVPAQQEDNILIHSENGRDKLEIALKALLFIQSSDNYVEVHFAEAKENSRKLIRNSLKAVALDLEKNKALFRCHKSYLVNMSRVNHVSGNAQGYKLHMSGTDVLIPVSRQYNAELKARLNF